jgi:hypothetical protein
VPPHTGIESTLIPRTFSICHRLYIGSALRGVMTILTVITLFPRVDSCSATVRLSEPYAGAIVN